MFVLACNRLSPSAAPTVDDVPKLPAKTGGSINVKIAGSLASGVPLNENISLQHYFTDADATITVDSSVRPAVRSITFTRVDTASGSQMLMRFAVNSWRDTGTVSKAKSAAIRYYTPTQSAAVKTYIGSVPNNANVDAIMRVNRLDFVVRDSVIERVRGEYIMSPVSNGAIGTLVSGTFDIPLTGYRIW